MPTRSIAIIALWFATLTGGATVATASSEPVSTAPPSTLNVFLPEQRPLSDCLNSLPRPNCGSKAQGGWRQGTIFALMVAGLAFIGWRITRLVRRNRREPDATSVPGGAGGGRGP